MEDNLVFNSVGEVADAFEVFCIRVFGGEGGGRGQRRVEGE